MHMPAVTQLVAACLGGKSLMRRFPVALASGLAALSANTASEASVVLTATIGGPYTFTSSSQSITIDGSGSAGTISYNWYRGVGADGPLSYLGTTTMGLFTDTGIPAGLPVGFVYTYGLSVNDPNGSSALVRTTATLVSDSHALPEPATWAMMLLGFAAIGAAQRRRRPPHTQLLQIA